MTAPNITLLDLLHHRDAFRPWFRDEAQMRAPFAAPIRDLLFDISCDMNDTVQ
jgi:hypothetical protein